MPELNLVDGLYQYSRPGLNALEREWYHSHVISQEGLLVKYQELAEKIAKGKGIEVSAVYEHLMGASSDVSKALEFFGGFFVEVQLIEEEQKRFGRCAVDRAAEMILRSRLKPDWIKTHLQDLAAEYELIISQDDLRAISSLPRSEWLDNSIRQKLISQLALPSWQSRELKEFVENELLEGETPKLQMSVEIAETLGKHQDDSLQQESRSNGSVVTLSEHIAIAPATG